MKISIPSLSSHSFIQKSSLCRRTHLGRKLFMNHRHLLTRNRSGSPGLRLASPPPPNPGEGGTVATEFALLLLPGPLRGLTLRGVRNSPGNRSKQKLPNTILPLSAKALFKLKRGWGEHESRVLSPTPEQSTSKKIKRVKQKRYGDP